MESRHRISFWNVGIGRSRSGQTLIGPISGPFKANAKANGAGSGFIGSGDGEAITLDSSSPAGCRSCAGEQKWLPDTRTRSGILFPQTKHAFGSRCK